MHLRYVLITQLTENLRKKHLVGAFVWNDKCSKNIFQLLKVIAIYVNVCLSEYLRI